MLIFPWFAFVHVPKAAGTFVRNNLIATLKDDLIYETPRSVTDGHQSFDALPRDFTAPVLAFVRNPWDWYVSWYHFLRPNIPRVDRSSDMYPFFEAVFARGRNDFATALRILCTQEPPHRFPAVRTRMAEGHDFYSALLQYFLGDGLQRDSLFIGKSEHLYRDLCRFFDGLAFDRRADLIDRFKTAVPENMSTHDHYRSYFSPQSRQLVSDRSRWTIDRFGYEF